MHTNNCLVEYYGGTKLLKSYRDIIIPQPEEKRTAEEIYYDITSKLNGTHNELI